MGTNEDPAGDARTARLLRDAMHRTTRELPPLPDLSGPARAQGRRRTARLRAAIGGGVLAVAVLGVAAAAALPAGGGKAAGVSEAAASPAPPSSAPPATPRPPVHLEPTPGETPMSALPEAERTRQEDFQNQAVGVLQGLLPESVGTLQRTDLSVRLYRATQGEKTFDVIFSVRPSGQDTEERKCLEIKGQTCARATLPDGTAVTAATVPTGSGEVTESRVSFHYGTSDVLLFITPHEASFTSAPVTKEQLLDVARSPAFLALVAQADSRPMEKAQTVVPGG